MDSDKKAYLMVLEEKKLNISKKIKDLKGKKTRLFDRYFDVRIAKLEGELKTINELIEKLKKPEETVEINGLNGVTIDNIEENIGYKKEKQDAIKAQIEQLNQAIANAKSKNSVRVLSRLRDKKKEKLAKLQKKVARMEKRQRFFAAPKVWADNYRNYKIGRKEGMVAYNKGKADDTMALANSLKGGSFIDSIRSSYYEGKSNYYRLNQMKYQSIVDKLKNNVTRVNGARTMNVPRQPAPALT